ncbi:transposable element Tcb2 transposase [Trichonephila clavipes]|nr:transposable element Tcb2 transposase [Trichonephila clavipes]
MSTMSRRNHLTDSEAWRVVGRLEGGQTQAEIAQAIGVSQNVISRIWNRFLETGSAGRRPGEGRRRATTPNEDRYLVLTARRHRNMNATILQQHIRLATGTEVSTQTVRNQLHGVGLYARRPMVCVRLTSRHRLDRREWVTEHMNWRINECSNVLLLTSPVFLFIQIIGVFSSGGTAAEDKLLAANHPHKLTKNWKELSWKSGTEYPNSRLIASLTPCLKGVQRCWPCVETIPSTENDFL